VISTFVIIIIIIILYLAWRVIKRNQARQLGTNPHHAVNDAIACSLTLAAIPVSKDPSGLMRTDGKRPDGLTLIPWQAGKPLTWDVMVVSTLAD